MTKVTYTLRKTILSILTLVLTFMALGTATFAWFSLSTVSRVSNITGDITVGDGLMIRLVEADEEGQAKEGGIVTPWKSNLTTEDVSTFVNNVAANLKFKAISKNDGNKFEKQAMKNKQHHIDGADAVLNEDYLTFVIEFKSQTEGNVKFASYELHGADVTFTSPVPFTDSKENEIGEDDDFSVTSYSANGMRFSLDNEIYQRPEDNSNAVHDNPIENGQWSFLKALGEELYYDNDLLEDIDDVLAIDTSAAKDTEDAELIELKKVVEATEYTASVLVTIWLEGWDADTYDVTYGGTIHLDLVFEKVTEEEDPIEP